MNKFLRIFAVSTALSAQLVMILTLLGVMFKGSMTIIAPYGEAPFEIIIFILGMTLLTLWFAEDVRNDKQISST
jgi:hypothetical protein